MIYELGGYPEVATAFCVDILRMARTIIKHHAERDIEKSQIG